MTHSPTLRLDEKRPRTSTRRGLLGSVLCACLALWGIAARGQTPSKTEEYRVKAAFLFHFAQLVEWPAETLEDPATPLTICTLRADPFRGALESVTGGKSIGTHALRVLHVSSTQDLKGCQIVFVNAQDRDTQVLLTKIKDDPVLTVGESDGFLDQGGMINLSVKENKVRFGINLEAAQRARLNISSRLLLLATRVIGNRKQG